MEETRIAVSHHRPDQHRWRRWTDPMAAPAALVVIVLIGYYRRWTQLGLYGDDHNFIGGAINRSWAAEWNYLRYCLTYWPQGRPLGNALNLSLIPRLAFETAGLPGVHLLAYAILTANAVLLYQLIRNFLTTGTTAPPGTSSAAAFSGAALYALSPASTVQLSLVYSYAQLSIMAGLLATCAAVRGRALLFGLALAVTMTMGEPIAMFALVVPPLLTFRRCGAWVWRTLRHVALWSAVVLSLLAVRRLLGDPWGGERVAEITGAPFETLRRAVGSATTGVATHVSLVAGRLVGPVTDGDQLLLEVAAVCGSIALAALTFLQQRDRDSQGRHQESSRSSRSVTPFAGALLLLAAGMLGMLVVYSTFFRPGWYPANWSWGFKSGVHIGAAPGAGLAAAGIVQLGLLTMRAKLRRIALLLPAVALGLLCGFGELVQREYVAVWKFQKEFWQAYRHLCRDATGGTYVLVLGHDLPQRRFIETFSWGTEILPGELFLYRDVVAAPPPGAAGQDGVWSGLGKQAPVVLITPPDLESAIRHDGAGFHWKPSFFMLPKNADQQPRDRNVIVLERVSGRWRRIEGAVKVEGGILTLRPAQGDLLDHVHATPLARVFEVDRALPRVEPRN
jgi:hypothetical protein